MPELHDTRIAALVLGAMAMLCGALLGGFFYGGLWWTVRNLARSRHPALTVFTSMLLRMGVALGGFYVVGHSDWARLMACLLGFLLARAAVTWFNRRWASAPAGQPTGLRHAP